MTDQLVVISKSDLAELFTSTLESQLSKFFKKELIAEEDKPIVYRSRRYVKELLNTTYTTIDKYSQEGKGQLLKPIYFGRRVLYSDEDLRFVLPKIKTILEGRSVKRS